MRKMKATLPLLIVSLLLMGIGALAQVVNFSVTVAGRPETVDDLSDLAPIIVEATVQSVFPTSEVGAPPTPETDSLLSVERVLKGTVKQGQHFVVGQRGGTLGQVKYVSAQFSLMEPGQRYVLFLEPFTEPSPNSGTRTISVSPPTVSKNRPDRGGAVRYSIVGLYFGLMRIEGDTAQWSKGMSPSFRNKYDGQNAQQTIANIERHLAIAR